MLVWSWAYFHRHATVVQIGAHAGNDLLGHVFDKRPHWRGVLVEPVNFERLVARRGGDPRFELVRAAITDHNGTTRMHLIVDGPEWTTEIASMDPTIVTEQDFQWRTVEVPCMTFAQLVKDLARIDVLWIDTEGHDAIVLDQVDLEYWRPGLIVFEHKHLADADHARCRGRLRDAGYRLEAGRIDTIAIRRYR